MLEAVRNAFTLPDLRRKIVFTLLILVVYRAGAHVPVPGVDGAALQSFLQSGSDGSTIVQFLNLLSGGALANFSIMAMGVYPYITASIIMQLLTPLIPQLQELSKEGEQGRNKINMYTLWITVPLALLQAYGQVFFIQSSVPGILTNFGFGVDPLTTIAVLVSMTAGTMVAVWLGELITEQGVGNGVSIIIFGGIVAQMPNQIARFVSRQEWGHLILFAIITVLTIAVIAFVQEGQRRIPVQYGKRVRGTKVYGGQSSHIPMKVNSAGMIPLIFAQSIMIFPSAVAASFTVSDNQFISNVATGIVTWFSPNPQSWPYWILYFLMVVGFTYFYTDVIFKQQNLADNLQRQGGFIPGIRPGKRTESYLNSVLQRITLVGALMLGGVAILPWLVNLIPGVSQSGSQTQALLITSTGLLIVVGVVLDTMKQLEAQLLMRNYEGFIN
ncbi:MAG TPA: preprotein translocase subunit SecY [Anaerolineae bacterium]|nr:preprotein translocase subunit SecY [Anaerolineae bacterium]MCB0179253.1 preprotein translocase subunit SecY [Anaerolineae bacterium]MCB9103165.1 preprotein translocase subunit SecY [Anaerolineales bacterium]HRV91236.1 preprotein translocase subunit SecY [Anaerolineae bacterium]